MSTIVDIDLEAARRLVGRTGTLANGSHAAPGTRFRLAAVYQRENEDGSTEPILGEFHSIQQDNRACLEELTGRIRAATMRGGDPTAVREMKAEYDRLEKLVRNEPTGLSPNIVTCHVSQFTPL